MTSLKELGVTSKYNPNKPWELEYVISIDKSELIDPKTTKDYFTKIVDRVSRDAKKKGALENLTVSVDEYLSDLHSVARDLSEKAKKHEESVDNFIDNNTFARWATVGGGIFGVVYGYYQFS